MASRHADRSRADRGRHEPPPRRDDRRYARDRDDRYDDRQDDRYDARDRRHGRDDRDRGGRRYERRSRSPAPRNRSRDRRDRGGDRSDRSDRRVKDYGRDRDSRDYRRRDDSRDSRRSDDRRRRSPASEARDKAARELKEKEELEQKKIEAQEAKTEKLKAWKKQMLEKKQLEEKQLEKKQQVESPGATASTTVTAPPTPAAVSSPTQQQVAKKGKPVEQKSTFKLDDSAKSRPLQSAAGVGTPATSANVPVLNPSGNVSSFGLKTKPTIEETAAKNLLGEEAGTEKRKLRVLLDSPSIEVEEPVVEVDNDDNSDDEEQLRAQLEKRRGGLAEEDTKMDDATNQPQEDKMEVVEEDVDPLDAFMQDLQPAPILKGPSRQGQVILADDNEPTMQAVEEDDLFAITAAKKKKKEVRVVDHTKIDYPPFRRNFYVEPQDIAALTEEEVADIRLELDGIKVRGENVPRPVTRWGQMGLLQQTLDVFSKLGYEKPTPIQCQSVPATLAGSDILAVAKTGSGKSLAFGIPLLRHIADQPPLSSSANDGPIVLILCPTRELSMQIVNELKPFLKASGLKITAVYGGAPISDQIATVKRGGISVMVGTPGRIIDLLNSNNSRILRLNRVTQVCIDEADRMFDLGFEPQVLRILSAVRPDAQKCVYSATFPPKMEALAKKILHVNPVSIIVGGRSVVAPEVEQIVKIVPPEPRKKFNELLLQLGKYLVDDDEAQCLIFVERQEAADDLLGKLLAKSYPADAIHGAKDFSDRNQALMDFKQKIIPILISTSVAARGLDIPKLRCVINYDSPSHLEDYVHRVGRTGRAGNKGTAVTFVESPGQERISHHIIKALKASGQPVPEDLAAMAKIFYDKVNAGEERWYDAGFSGKGLDKLDAARALEKKREKLAHRIEGEADESEDEPKPILPAAPVVKRTGETTEPSTPVAATPAPPVDEPSYMRILREGIVVTKTERPVPDQKQPPKPPKPVKPSKPLSVMERVRMAAGGVDTRLSKKGTIHAGQPIDNKGPDAGLYHSTIEINDFPQKARWGVTNRTNVARILDATGTSITSKGIHYATGREPGEGDAPKLYILVEGDTENQVSSAMSELQRLLREGTAADAEGPAPARGATGRYNVLS